MILTLYTGRVVFGFAKDVLLEQEGILPGRTDESHILQLGDRRVEVFGHLFFENILIQVLIVIEFQVDRLEHLIACYLIEVDHLNKSLATKLTSLPWYELSNLFCGVRSLKSKQST